MIIDILVIHSSFACSQILPKEITVLSYTPNERIFKEQRNVFLYIFVPWFQRSLIQLYPWNFFPHRTNSLWGEWEEESSNTPFVRLNDLMEHSKNVTITVHPMTAIPIQRINETQCGHTFSLSGSVIWPLVVIFFLMQQLPIDLFCEGGDGRSIHTFLSDAHTYNSVRRIKALLLTENRETWHKYTPFMIRIILKKSFLSDYFHSCFYFMFNFFGDN